MKKLLPPKRLVTLGIALAATAPLAACASTPTSPHAQGGTPTTGGNLIIARAEDTKTLDPVAAVTPDDIAPQYEIYDQLYRLSNDGKTLKPDLAVATPRSSAHGTIWTIKLRKDAKFTNGEPVTAADVRYSLDRARTSNGAFSFLLSMIKSVGAPDKDTVVITTNKASATLVPALGSWIASILPKDLDGKSKSAFFSDPIGSGPFRLGKWVPGQFLQLTRNPAYWQHGRPYLDSVRWNTVPDANTRVSQVQAGQADLASDVPFSRIASLKSASSVTAGTFPANYTTMLIFNGKFAPFADIHVRQAIAQAVDRDAVTKATLFGAGTPACSLLAPTTPFASKPDCFPYDPSAAKAELKRSRFPHGFEVELTIDNLPSSSTTAQIVQTELAAIGVKVKIKVVDSGQIYTVFGHQGYQMGLAAWASDIPDPDEQLSFMLDPSAGGNSYYTGFDDPQVTSLIRQGRSTVDVRARSRAYSQIQEIAAEQVPQLPISYQNNAYLWSRKVEQLEVNPMGVIDLADVGLTK